MNTTLSQFLETREAQIKQQMAELRQELKEIKAAKGVIVKSENDEVSSKVTRKRSKTTIKDMIISVLDDYGKGADALTIIELIKEKYDKEITRPSISPQLSRLKDEGIIDLDNKIWMLSSENNEPPEGGSQEFPKGNNGDDVDASSNINNPNQAFGYHQKGGGNGSF